MLAPQATRAFRQDASSRGTLLTSKQRENLLQPYLPRQPRMSGSQYRKQQPIRNFLKTQLYLLVFHIIHTIFSIYIRLRQTYHVILDRTFAVLYYHHRAPELITKDIRGLSRLPQHLSVIIELKGEERGTAGLEALMDDLAELSAWCACVGIPLLSVYEKTGMSYFHDIAARWLIASGILKSYIPTTHRTVSRKMHSYFGQAVPSVQIRAPHVPSFLNGDASEGTESLMPSPGRVEYNLLNKKR